MTSPNASSPPSHPLGRPLDCLAEITGRTTAWLTLIMVIITSLVVLLRHVFGIGLIALQESVTYMHALVFMLGAGYTLKHQGHVRVDIYYRRFGPRGRAWVDALGGLVFALPLVLFIGFSSLGFVQRAWAIHEISTDSGGLPFVYLLKSLLPLMALSLSLQILAEVLRNLLVLMNVIAPNEQAAEGESC